MLAGTQIKNQRVLLK